MCPESSVWATKARLEQTRSIEAANRRGGTDDCARPVDPAARRRARARARPGRRRLGRTRPSRGRWSGRQPCLCRARRPPDGGPVPIAAARTQRRRQTAATENRNGPDERHHRVLGAAR
ncbi:hypothetical protein OG717_01045 [Streptomyces celluloflavus]|nr:hypothetical protein OG717_01045 [Streptomyces celluloflavus]